MLESAARKWLAPVGLWRVFGRDRLQLVALGEDVAATRIHMEEFIQAYQREPRLKYGADFDTEFTMLLATVNAASGAAFLDVCKAVLAAAAD